MSDWCRRRVGRENDWVPEQVYFWTMWRPSSRASFLFYRNDRRLVHHGAFPGAVVEALDVHWRIDNL